MLFSEWSQSGGKPTKSSACQEGKATMIQYSTWEAFLDMKDSQNTMRYSFPHLSWQLVHKHAWYNNKHKTNEDIKTGSNDVIVLWCLKQLEKVAEILFKKMTTLCLKGCGRRHTDCDIH